jgi:hypothetical protein
MVWLLLPKACVPEGIHASNPVLPAQLPLMLLNLLLLPCSGGVGRVVCCRLLCCNPGEPGMVIEPL